MSCDHTPKVGLTAQTDITTDHTVFIEAYAVTTEGVMSNIVAGYLPCKDMNRHAKMRGMGGSYQ